MTAHPSEDVDKLWKHLNPQLASLLSQTWQVLARSSSLSLQASASAPFTRSITAQNGQIDQRRHGRVAVRLLSQVSSQAVAAEGELLDLSPGGCRITSPIRVPLGTALECWFYPQDEHPFAVDEATVRWIRPREFGLVFTKVRPGVRRTIENICRNVDPPDR